MDTPEAFLFDIGNVLVCFDFEPFLAGVRARSPLPPAEIDRVVEFERSRYESGVTDTGEFVGRVMGATSYGGSPGELASLWRNIFTENPPMADTVTRLASRHPLYLLSNTNPLHLEHLRAEFDVLRHFRGGVYSYEVGSEKPDPRIYQAALTGLGLDPGRTMYIDDRPENIDAGKRLGFNSHAYDPTRHTEFLALLEQAGVPVG